jgi:Nif-specific regulatory protein
MERMSLKYGKKVTRLSEPAVNMLLAWKWPGNVRELENCIERAVLTATDDTIHGYNLPPQLQAEEYAESPYGTAEGDQETLAEKLAAYERRVLEEAIRRNNGNHSAAGRQLGVSPRMMNYRLAKLGLIV